MRHHWIRFVAKSVCVDNASPNVCAAIKMKMQCHADNDACWRRNDDCPLGSHYKDQSKETFLFIHEQADLESDALSFVLAIRKEKKFPGDYN